MNKIEDAVASGIHARNEGRPGHGTQGRHGGLKGLEIALGDEPLEMGQISRLNELLQQLGIEPVDRQDENFLGRRPAALDPEEGANHDEQDEDALVFHGESPSGSFTSSGVPSQ